MFYCKLTCNLKARDEDITFSKFVSDVGNGHLNDNNHNIDIPERCITTDSNFINPIYKHLIRNHLYDVLITTMSVYVRVLIHLIIVMIMVEWMKHFY